MGLADSYANLRETIAGVEGLDLTPYDEFGASLGAFEEGSAAKVAELEALVAELQQANSLLKAQNYDLLMTGPGTPEEAPAEGDNDDSPADDDAPDIEDYE